MRHRTRASPAQRHFLPRQNQDDCREHDSAGNPGQEDRSSRRCSKNDFAASRFFCRIRRFARRRRFRGTFTNHIETTLGGHFVPHRRRIAAAAATGLMSSLRRRNRHSIFSGTLQGLTIQSADGWRPSIFIPLRPLSNRRDPMLNGRKPTFSGA